MGLMGRLATACSKLLLPADVVGCLLWTFVDAFLRGELGIPNEIPQDDVNDTGYDGVSDVCEGAMALF